MNSFPESMSVFKKELEKGQIIEAYQGLMAYFRELRTHFSNSYPDYEVPGNIYYGYLDMTYFSILPPTLKEMGLKIAVVFIYETFRFEVWLSGRNRVIQNSTSQVIQDQGWQAYHLTPSPGTADSILDHVLVEDPDFGDLSALTQQIDRGTLEFIGEVEKFFLNLP